MSAQRELDDSLTKVESRLEAAYATLVDVEAASAAAKDEALSIQSYADALRELKDRGMHLDDAIGKLDFECACVQQKARQMSSRASQIWQNLWRDLRELTRRIVEARKACDPTLAGAFSEFMAVDTATPEQTRALCQFAMSTLRCMQADARDLNSQIDTAKVLRDARINVDEVIFALQAEQARLLSVCDEHADFFLQVAAKYCAQAGESARP